MNRPKTITGHLVDQKAAIIVDYRWASSGQPKFDSLIPR